MQRVEIELPESVYRQLARIAPDAMKPAFASIFFNWIMAAGHTTNAFIQLPSCVSYPLLAQMSF